MPKKALHPCSDCKRNLTRERHCDACKPNHTAQERGYGWRWRKLRNAIMERDKGLCQPCLELGHITRATAVDHIRPKAQAGTDEPHNLRAICGDCHSAKTAQENRV